MSAALIASSKPSHPSAGPGRLELVLLGSPHVVLPDGRLVRFAVDKALMLLAYLAYEPDEPKRRSELAALLYPDHADDQANVNLRQTLLRLRRAIGDEATEPPYLLSTQLNLQFNAISACWFDVVEFETIIAAVQRHRHRRLAVCRDCLSQLARAVQLYRGDFLSGLAVPSGTPYGDWLQVVRDDLRRKATWALHVLTPYHVQHAHYDAAQACIDRLLQLDALDEEAIRAEMQLKALQGQRNLALRVYHDFKRRLLDELDTTPEPDTLQLAAAIRADQSPLKRSGQKQHKDTLLTLQDFSPTALPNTLLPFIGREPEMARITTLLSSQDCRLITLTGPGGIGKTRLAMRAAADDALAWDDGVWLVLLDDSSAAVDLEDTLIRALGLPVRATLSRRFQIYDFLRDKELLLLLDNFERKIDEAGLVKSLLDHAPRLKIIATSRQRLGLRGEQVLELGGLDFPRLDHGATPIDLPHLLARYSALQLFVEHARRLNPAFALDAGNVEAISQICQRLDGLPLGIELAAAWTHVFPCEDILDRLTHNVDFLRSLSRDVPLRHASLRAVFDYSWRLLTPAERQALNRLALSPMDCAAPLALDPCLLAALKDKSFLKEHTSGRWSVHPLLRPFAAEQAARELDTASI